MPTEHAQELTAYIRDVISNRGVDGVEIREDTPLISAGLIDSLALVNILFKVEDVTHTFIPAGKVQPHDMDTVNLMLATAERLGKPRE